MREIRLGLLFSWGGIGAGYFLLMIAFVIYAQSPKTFAINPLFYVLVLGWLIIQFSFWSIEFNPSKNAIRVTRRILWFIKLGTWIPVSDFEAFYTRPANIKSSISRGLYMHIDMTKDFRFKSWLVEIKLKYERKYRPIVECKATKAKQIALEIFKAAGIPHQKIIKQPIQRRRR